jgi:hypothetical protein
MGIFFNATEIEDTRISGRITFFIISVILTTFFILSLVFSSHILNDSVENPLKKEKPSDKDKYFNEIESSYFELLSLFINNDKNYENNTLINLGEDSINCENIKDLILLQNSSLKDIFKLNIDSIHSNSASLIAINVIIFVFGFLIYIPNKLFGECLCEICGCCCCDKSDRKSYENCADYCGSICLVLIVFIFLITNIIIFSILCSKYNTDDTENFLSFLQCKNINKEAFEKYLVLNDLSSHISLLKAFQSIFIVLDFIFLIMSLILKCCFFRQQ